MKIFLIAIFVVSLLQSDEMKRIKSIVDDIAKLRADYEVCQDTLKSKKTIKVDIVEYKKDEIEIREYKKLLKIQRQKNVILKAEIDYMNESASNSDKVVKVCKKKEDDNPFPKLMPKDNPKVKTFKASAFRLKISSAIYDKPDGKKIDIWKKTRSFTSNQKTTNWTKITGYFVDKKWVRAKKEMWIKNREIFKRDY